MPQILIVTDSAASAGEVVYRERVLAPELCSTHFSAHLIERLGWALGDATALEQQAEKRIAGVSWGRRRSGRPLRPPSSAAAGLAADRR
jgi:hypothetical protein